MREEVVLITGGGRGIGAACARLAAKRANVVVNYLKNATAAEETCHAIEVAGGKAISVQADAAQDGDIGTLYHTIDREFGPLTGLINNAGVVDRHQRLDQIKAQRIEHIFQVNVFGPMLCAREAVRRMSTRHGGSGGAIVNISSGAALTGAPGVYVDYASSKGAIDTFTLGLAREVAREGIRVNGVRPGMIHTEIHSSGGAADRVNDVSDQIALGRGGTADEVAEAVIWLLSDQASYVTGAILNVNGGGFR